MKNFTLITLFFTMSIFSQKTETHSYKTIFSKNNFEIRNYDPVMKARTFSKTDNNNFMKLFRYISGNNQENQKIAMTTPVHMQESLSEKEKKYTMRFVMPSKYTMNDLSKPNDSRIVMEKVDKKKYAAITYSGYNNSTKFSFNSTKLRRVVDENNISYKDNPIYLGYDAPYKVWGRKNDILFELSE